MGGCGCGGGVGEGCFWGVSGAYSRGECVVGRGARAGVWMGDLEGFWRVWCGGWVVWGIYIRYRGVGVGVWIWRMLGCIFVDSLRKMGAKGEGNWGEMGSYGEEMLRMGAWEVGGCGRSTGIYWGSRFVNMGRGVTNCQIGEKGMIVERGWGGIGVGDIMINFAQIGQESKKRRCAGGVESLVAWRE